MSDEREEATDEAVAEEGKRGLRPGRRRLTLALVIVASVLTFVSLFGLWVERQAFNSDVWEETSTELLADEDVRDAVAAFVIDALYQTVDVEGEVSGALPEQAEPLAGPIAGGLRQIADRGAVEALEQPFVQQLWAVANRIAHERFIEVVDGGGDVVGTEEGRVTIDLAPVLRGVADRVGFGQKVIGQIPQGAAVIEVMDSDELEGAQATARVLRDAGSVLALAALALFALAIWLSEGRRRETVRAAAVGLIVAGVLALIFRGVVGNILVDTLASTESVRPAAESVWTIATERLIDTAWWTIILGLVAGLGTWIAGPGRAAVTVRRELAPFLNERVVAYGVVVALAIFAVLANTEGVAANPIVALVLLGALIAGMEALHHQTKREHPDADLATARAKAVAFGKRLGELAGSAARRVREGSSAAADAVAARTGGGAAEPSAGEDTGAAPAAVAAESARLEALERLADLRDRGVLSDEEFAAEKAQILGGD